MQSTIDIVVKDKVKIITRLNNSRDTYRNLRLLYMRDPMTESVRFKCSHSPAWKGRHLLVSMGIDSVDLHISYTCSSVYFKSSLDYV